MNHKSYPDYRFQPNFYDHYSPKSNGKPRAISNYGFDMYEKGNWSRKSDINGPSGEKKKKSRHHKRTDDSSPNNPWYTKDGKRRSTAFHDQREFSIVRTSSSSAEVCIFTLFTTNSIRHMASKGQNLHMLLFSIVSSYSNVK